MRLTAIVREPEPVRVEVDRPFLFLVRHRDSGALYFLARITDPS
jgi:serine protease inhibitor